MQNDVVPAVATKLEIQEGAFNRTYIYIYIYGCSHQLKQSYIGELSARLLGGVFAGEHHDGLLASRVVRQEVGDVQDLQKNRSSCNRPVATRNKKIEKQNGCIKQKEKKWSLISHSHPSFCSEATHFTWGVLPLSDP